LKLTNLLQSIYDQEFNAKIEWFWDAGITVTLGDTANGWGESKTFDTMSGAINWLYFRGLN